MKLNRTLALICAFLFTAAFTAFITIDGDPIQKAAAQLDKWMSTNPFEKVYLHFDKPYYAVGDNIWFKAYITVGGNHELSGISNILNVELIDDQDSVRKTIKLPVTAGLAWGDFILEDSLREGNYRIRAYTNWMRNAGPDYFFDKTISIVNAENNVFTKTDYSFAEQNGQGKINASIRYSDINGAGYAGKQVNYEVRLGPKSIARGKGITDANGDVHISFAGNQPLQPGGAEILTEIKLSDKKSVSKIIPVKALSSRVVVQFFPESGSLVSGVSTTVAFKAVGADGLGADIKGVVTDDESRNVAQFASQHAGMGAFNMRPQTGRRYKAHISYPDGSENDVDLPTVMDKGYVLSVSDLDSTKIAVRITASRAQMEADSTSVVSLVAQSGGKIYYAAKGSHGRSSFQAVIPKEKFPSGIVQFTLFSAAGELLNERLAFIQNKDYLRINLSGAKTTYTPREKMKLDFDAKDKEQKPVTGSFSIAVTDETKVPVDAADEGTIFSTILLTSDLRGYIEKPNYYFTDVNEKTRADLDLLMLTQGYRRFEWKQLMNDVYQPIVFHPEKTLVVSGHIKTSGGKAVPHARVTLFSSSGGVLFLDTVSDENGRFVFSNLIFKDSVKFIVQARTEKNRSNVEIEIDNIPQLVTVNKNVADVQVNIADKMLPYLSNRRAVYDDELRRGVGNHGLLLKEVTIKAVKEPAVKNSSNLNGPGNADQIIKAGPLLQGCAFIADCLQGRILGVIFKNGVPYSTRSPNIPMQIVLDGSFVSSDVLNSLAVDNIESIEVLRSIMYTAIYGGQGSGGLLLINTKRGGDADVYQRYAPGLITIRPRGYYQHRVFYSPQYDDPKTNASLPDLRSTIYWNPNIVTDKNGAGSFAYFNADAQGTYRVVIEGIDANGNLGRCVYHYKVQ